MQRTLNVKIALWLGEISQKQQCSIQCRLAEHIALDDTRGHRAHAQRAKDLKLKYCYP